MTDTREPPAAQAASTARAQTSFIWYELLTNDHARAKSFYDAVVGWDIESEATNSMDYRMIRTPTGNAGGVMQINDEMRSHGARPTWLGYLGVEDVDQIVAAATAAGASIVMPAFDVADVGRIAMLADPSGAPFYVMRPIPPAGNPDAVSTAFAPNLIGHCAWNELVTRDLAQAKQFYPALFGWTLGDVMPMGPMGDYQFIEQDGRMIGAMFAPGDRQPAWRFCFRTADLQRSIDAVNEGGGQVLFGPTEVPGGGRIIQATDPDGAFFMVIEGGQS